MVQSEIDAFSLWWKGNDYLSNYGVAWKSFEYLTDKQAKYEARMFQNLLFRRQLDTTSEICPMSGRSTMRSS